MLGWGEEAGSGEHKCRAEGWAVHREDDSVESEAPQPPGHPPPNHPTPNALAPRGPHTVLREASEGAPGSHCLSGDSPRAQGQDKGTPGRDHGWRQHRRVPGWEKLNLDWLCPGTCHHQHLSESET